MLETLRPIALEIRRRGGRLLVTGGFVRDRLLGRETGDLDLEVLGLAPRELDEALARFGKVRRFGAAFPVRQLEGLPAQFSLARRDSRPAAEMGAGETSEASDPHLDFTEAARRRDLTINALGLDPLTGEILDPVGGRADLEAGVLRAADPARFGDDPLRGLRVMQLAARLEMEPDAELIAACRRLDLEAVPGERMLPEFDKLLLRSAQPSRGLAVLRQTGLLRCFPELAALVGVPQDPEWHPEGDVWVHTLLTIDAAARLRPGGPRDVVLMYGALCHDFGKPGATREIEGRITARGHDRAGVEVTEHFLTRLRSSRQRVRKVCALVEHHLAPALLDAGGATPKAYRRLARRLAAAHVDPGLLERLARADHLGRTTADARRERFPAGDRFLLRMAELDLLDAVPGDVVHGSDLLARGFEPGESFGRILERCREIQDETGVSDPAEILDRALQSLDLQSR